MKIVRNVVVAAFVAAASFFSSAQFTEHPVEKKIGDVCSYRTVDAWTGAEEYQFSWTFVRADKNGYGLIEKNETIGLSFGVEMSPEFNVTEVQGGVKYELDASHYSFPLFVGKEWETESKFSAPKLSGTYLNRGKVLGVEQITVPAGTFSVMKIEVRTYVNALIDGSSHRSWIEVRTIWYIPEIGCPAKRTLVMENGSRAFRSVVTEMQSYRR